MGAKSQQLQIRVTPEQKAALRRKAERAGQDLSTYVLTRVLPAAGQRIAELLGMASGAETRRFALAELNDVLSALAPARLVEATSGIDVSSLSPFVANYVAAMIEQASHQKGVGPPAWVEDVEPLQEPWFAVPYASVRLHLLRSAPVPFKRRNLFVDAAVGDRV